MKTLLLIILLQSPFNDAIEHLKEREGFRANYYTGASGAQIIGYGHKRLKGETYKGLTKQHATELLKSDFTKHIKLVKNKYPLDSYRQHIALALMSFNMGNAKLNKAVRNGITKDRNKWLRYCHYRNSKGVMVKSKHLYQRRLFETNLYFK